MIRRVLLPSTFVALACLSTASADVVTTKDGLVVEGAATRAKDGSVTVTTTGGDVRLASSDVVTITTGEGPRAAAERARSALGKDDATGHFRLALALDAEGHPDLAKREYEAVLAVEPEHPAARRALGYERVGDRWSTVAEVRRQSGLVLYQGRWLLAAEVDKLARGKKRVAVKDVPLVTAMKTAAKSPALREAAVARIAKATDADRVEAARALLVHHDPEIRRWACHELQTLGDESALRTLIAVSVRDTNPTVRDAAIRAAATFGNDDVAIPLVRELGSDHPTYVANAARSLAMLGDMRAVGYLVTRITSHGSSPGGYFAHETQTAYIRDFDVEVAQTSFIADPIIGTIEEGAVADVKVLDVSMEKTIVETILIDSFNHLTRATAKNADDVRAWAKANPSKITDFSAVPVSYRSVPDAAPADAPPGTGQPAPASPVTPAGPAAPESAMGT